MREQYEMTVRKLESDFLIEKRNLDTLSAQHLVTIEDLIHIKNDLTAENRRLNQILQKKEGQERQRRQLLKTEMKEIDKLEKVIDRIVE